MHSYCENAGKETKRNPNGTKRRMLLMTSQAVMFKKTERILKISSYKLETETVVFREKVNGIRVKKKRNIK